MYYRLYHTIGREWYQSQSAWSKTVMLHSYFGVFWLHTWLVAWSKVCLWMLWSFSSACKTGLFGVWMWGKDWFAAEPVCNCSKSTTTTISEKCLFPWNLKKDEVFAVLMPLTITHTPTDYFYLVMCSDSA